MRLRTKCAIYIAKTASILVRMLRRGDGAVWPGYIAQRIDPDILSELCGMVRKKTIVVMGTNGKTTTNSIIYTVLTAAGNAVVTNRTGANMLNGIIGAFVLAASWKGARLDADYACIEVDENASTQILPALKPDCIVLTNISRDQLDRYGEVDIVRDRIRKAVSSVPDARLILNCDDVLSYTLSYECKNPVTACGINEQIFDQNACSAASRESIFCRLCGTKLEYDEFYYGQLGIWHCPNCNSQRPAPDYAASGITLQGGTYSFFINGEYIKTKARAAYNVYNTLSAYAALDSIGAAGSFAEAVGKFDYGNNRETIFQINGSCVQLHLAKNPAGFQQKVSLILRDEAPKDIIIQINDSAQDGKDISWLWDVDFQNLADANAASIYIGGTRRYDMALRLKYENISNQFVDDMQKTIQMLTLQGTGSLYVVVNYSGLFKMRDMLAQMQDAG